MFKSEISSNIVNVSAKAKRTFVSFEHPLAHEERR